jgi:hypothetical protein
MSATPREREFKCAAFVDTRNISELWKSLTNKLRLKTAGEVFFVPLFASESDFASTSLDPSCKTIAKSSLRIRVDTML